MSPSPEEITGSAPRPRQPAPPAEPAARPPAPWKVEHTLTLEDCAAFFRYHLDHPLQPRDDPYRHSWLFMILFGLLTLLSVAACFSGGVHISLSAWVPGLFLLFFLLYTFLFFFGKRFRLWSLLRSIRHNRQFFDPRTLEISEEAITTTLPSGTFGYRWHTLERIIEQPDHAFFYISRGEAIILPKRVFAHERDFEEFVDAARRHRAEARRFVRTEGPA
jgi:hypothetical protein